VLPFTREQFVAVFSDYNQAVWPVQIFAYGLGGLAVFLLFNRGQRSDRAIAAILAVMWAWTGVGYHLFFAEINRAAYAFSAVFVVQAAILAYAGTWRRRIRFGIRDYPGAWIGVTFIAYAAALYPVIGVATGHRYPGLPMFGITPCPVTIFTFGMLLLTLRPPPSILFAIPVLWSLIGGSAAFLLGVPQDWLLLFSGVTAGALILHSRRAYRGLTQS
jgi:hypothetical protein